MLKIGKKQILFVQGTDNDFISEKRLSGASAVFQMGSLRTKENDSSLENGYKIGKGILKKEKWANGIICSSSILAAGILKVFSDNEISVPDDIAVISFEKFPISEYTKPTLTVIDINLHDLGVHVGKVMMDKLGNHDLIIQQLILSSDLIIGGSTMRYPVI